MDTARSGDTAVVGTAVVVITVEQANTRLTCSFEAGITQGTHIPVITRHRVRDCATSGSRVTLIGGANQTIITYQDGEQDTFGEDK